MTTTVAPVILETSQRDRAAAVLADAFDHDPLYTRLFTDPVARARSLHRMWRGVVAYCQQFGVIHTTPDVAGAACWLSPGYVTMTFWRMLRSGLALPRAIQHFEPAIRRDFQAAESYMDEVHERLMPQPHWYLWALGVRTVSQGQGIGSQLITPMLARADESGLPCYLETLTETNVTFYQKRGFTVAGEAQLPGLDIAFWIMVREARRTTARSP